jgi:hypothetical protein
MIQRLEGLCRREFIAGLGAALASGTVLADPARRYQVGAYYFPNWHVDPRMEAIHGPGWTEWELLKRAEPRFPGHQQPKRPMWGYEDESDPAVFERKIEAAADHALTHFIFDWYWYGGSPFLERCLDQGYMKARNNGRLRFALMWANHVWVDLFPAKLNFKPTVVFDAKIRRADFDKLTDHVVSKYFSHPSYWKLDGSPYFSIYELYRLVENLGGIEPAAAALASFRAKTKAAGFPDLHLNAVTWGIQILPGEKRIQNGRELLTALGFNSTTSYVWIHHVPLTGFPVTPYDYAAKGAAGYSAQAFGQNGLPYHPNVTMGWDPSPRTCQSDRYLNKGYPFTPTLGGNTPAAFQKALESTKHFLDSTPQQPPILTLNAWNEWTEGSYLEPDTISGMKYLEAVRSVFG